MLHIAICDDQVSQLSMIHRSVEKYFSSHHSIYYEISDFSDSLKLLEKIQHEGAFDIIILDVMMPKALGTEIAGEIRKRSEKSEIIFISSSRDYALDAFSYNAVHYILKPFSDDDLAEALDRAMKNFTEKSIKKILLHLENGVVQSVDVEDISYIESVNYRRIVHVNGTTYEETKTTLAKFAEELELLSPGSFFQPYRGYIVNLAEIRTITPNCLVLRDGTSIMIKRGDFRKIRDLYFQWSFREKK